MDYNQRAKTSPYILENETFSFKEKTEEKWELRKKRNQNIIMSERKKRLLQLSQNSTSKDNNNINNINITNFNEAKNDTILLNENDLLIKLPPINSIVNSINEITKYLSSENKEENKWIIWALRVYFEKINIPYNEYSILFENDIHKYFETLLNKYQYESTIVNEIFFIITNLFDSDDIVHQYPKKYFEYFLSDAYISIYLKVIMLEEDELVDSIILLLRNILSGNYDLIKNLFNNNKELFYSIIEFLKEKFIGIENIKNIIKFFTLVFIGIQNSYINDTKLFILILDSIFMLYRNINTLPNKEIKIINYILEIYKCATTCKAKENDNNEYFVFDYLFHGINRNSPKFIKYFCENLKKSRDFYFTEISLYITSLELLKEVTYNSTRFQIEQLVIKYGLIDILNDLYSFKDNFKNIYQIIKLILKICNNIIDSDLNLAKILINSKAFENLILYFSLNISNKNIMNIYLNMFQRLLNYGEKNIAENLNKRGVIKDGIFNSFQSLNEIQNEEKLNEKKCKIILCYLNIMYDDSKEKNKILDKDDYLLGYQFKELLLSGLLNIPEDDIESLMNAGIMKLIET